MMESSDGDLYRMLGVSPHASTAEVKSAFQALALQHHPDKQGDTHRFAAIHAAYTTLSNEATRATYDRTYQRQRDQMTASISDEIPIADMSQDGNGFCVECRCGGEYMLTAEERSEGVNVIGCTHCGLYIRVLW
eukprot:GGOE01044345.1.p1 GENE.GGOE01044345.1~~GGOE01044345.1.p1  ORF type:complete len:134 (+),score=30.31 GGOE01044345.1:99-500(+)